MKDLRVAGIAGPPGAALLAALFLAVACSKTEPASSKPRPNAPLQVPAAAADKAASSGESVEALKERLARQEVSAAPAATPAPVVPAPSTSTTPVAAPSAAAAPPKAAPATPPPTLAATRPAPAPAPALAAPKLRTRTDLVFPREAMQAGIDAGLVKARMTLDGAGNVTRVDVVDANPRRVFDRAVVRSLSEWKYDEGASGRTVTVELEFRR